MAWSLNEMRYLMCGRCHMWQHGWGSQQLYSFKHFNKGLLLYCSHYIKQGDLHRFEGQNRGLKTDTSEPLSAEFSSLLTTVGWEWHRVTRRALVPLLHVNWISAFTHRLQYYSVSAFYGQHNTVVSGASKPEGPGFDSELGSRVFLCGVCLFSAGFPPGSPVYPTVQKHAC